MNRLLLLWDGYHKTMIYINENFFRHVNVLCAQSNHVNLGRGGTLGGGNYVLYNIAAPRDSNQTYSFFCRTCGYQPVCQFCGFTSIPSTPEICQRRTMLLFVWMRALRSWALSSLWRKTVLSCSRSSNPSLKTPLALNTGKLIAMRKPSYTEAYFN